MNELNINEEINKKNNNEKSKRIRWTNEEDNLLIYAISQENIGNWKKISEYLIDRNASQCRERWKTKLDPNINLNNSTYIEDQQIIYLQNIFGNKWSLISKKLIGRSPNYIKNRFLLLKRNNFILNKKLYKKKKINEENNFLDFDFEDNLSLDLFTNE